MSNGLCSPYLLFSASDFYSASEYLPCICNEVACMCKEAFKLGSFREAGSPGKVKLFQSTPPVFVDKSNTDQQFTVTGKNLTSTHRITSILYCREFDPF